MYKRLTRSRIRLEIASPAYLELEIIQIIIFPCINAWRDSVRCHLNDYLAMYTRLTRSHIHVELASLVYIRVDLAFPAYLCLGII